MVLTFRLKQFVKMLVYISLSFSVSTSVDYEYMTVCGE